MQRYKRKRNRIPLNFLTSQKRQKKRYKLENEVVTVSLNPATSNVHSAASSTADAPADVPPPPDDYAEYHEEDDASATLSTHTRRKEKLAEKWNALRDTTCKKMIQAYALPPGQKCAMCDDEDGNVRCQQCGPLFMCQNCCVEIHSKLHYHHLPESWQVCTFINV